MFLVGGELSGIWDVPKTTGVVVWPCEDLVTVWGEVCYMYSPEQKQKRETTFTSVYFHDQTFINLKDSLRVVRILEIITKFSRWITQEIIIQQIPLVHNQLVQSLLCNWTRQQIRRMGKGSEVLFGFDTVSWKQHYITPTDTKLCCVQTF